MKDKGMAAGSDWFIEWFNSPYYHILYQNRDEQEAAVFLEKLVKYLGLPASAKLLDLPCGKGRHAHFLHELGFSVTGADLAPESIAAAKEQASAGQTFLVHDIRKPFPEKGYDAVLNLFTSLGYFEDEKDDLAAFQTLADAVKPGGRLVIDFMNTARVVASLVPEEQKVVGEIQFSLKRRVEQGFIKKEIRFRAEGKEFKFQEQVKAISRAQFEHWGKLTNLKLLGIFGSYNLDPFEVNTSDRMIFIFAK